MRILSRSASVAQARVMHYVPTVKLPFKINVVYQSNLIEI